MIFTRFRNRFGIPGVISVIALVFAMLGGAYAASGPAGPGGGATASATKGPPGKRGPKGPRGKTGATGQQGPAGQQGSAGPPGAKGDSGAAGKDGIDGVDGTFSTEPLPEGESLTGAWGTSGGEGGTEQDISLVPISFPIEVSPPPLALYQFEFSPGESAGIELLDGSVAFYEAGDPEAFEDACPGSAESPEATSGFLCIYQGATTGTVANPFGNGTLSESANSFGLVVPFKMNTGSSSRGSWAVTG